MKLINFRKAFFTFLFSCCLIFSCFAMQETPTSESPEPSAQPSTTTTNETPSVYIPQHFDASEMLHKESVCCLFTSRWLLQPINVIAPLLATGLVGAAEYLMDDYPGTAKILNGIGLACTAVQFVTSVFLVKINDKQQGIDNYISTKHQQPSTAQPSNTTTEMSETPSN